MSLYKDVECQNYHAINEQILAFVKDQGIDSSSTFWNAVDIKIFLRACPLFFKWTMQHNLMLDGVAVTVGKSERPVRPHVDTPPARFKLSWPIANSDMTWNRWFEVIVPDPDVEINELGGLAYNNLDHLREIDRRRVDRPGLIDAGIPHDIFYEKPGLFPRLGLQCKLRQEPDTL